jgi:hypothetical protein
MSTFKINTSNYSGYSANITYTPYTGGSAIIITGVTLPYVLPEGYQYGNFSVYFPTYGKTCEFDVIPDCNFGVDVLVLTATPTPTTTSTPTPTPTSTPTNTPSPTPSPTPNCDFNVGVIVLTATPTPTPSPTSSPSPTPSPTSSPSPTPSATPNCDFNVDVITLTATPMPTATPTATPPPPPSCGLTSGALPWVSYFNSNPVGTLVNNNDVTLYVWLGAAVGFGTSATFSTSSPYSNLSVAAAYGDGVVYSSTYVTLPTNQSWPYSIVRTSGDATSLDVNLYWSTSPTGVKYPLSCVAPTPTPTSTPTNTPSPTPTATVDCTLDTTITPELTEVVNCLANMEFIVQYSPTAGPCPGGHTCNAATFYLRGNNITIGTVYLSNTGGSNDQFNYPAGVTSGYARYNSLTLTTQQAQDIAATSVGGNINFSLVCATPPNVNLGFGNGGCHTNVTWVTLKLNNETIYSGCPNNNFLTINPCTGVIS